MGFGYRDQFCGTLFCSGGWDFPVTSKKSFYTVRNGDICNEAAMNPEDNYPADLGMVPTGTKCGNNMVRKLPMLLLAVSIKKPSVACFNVLTMSFRCATSNGVKTSKT